MAQARELWKAGQASLDPTKLVFVDETGTNTKMVRAYGRCAKGQRLIGRQPFGHWKTTTFTAGLRCDGITAPFVLDGPMNRAAFLVYIDKILGPTLKPGDIVIMDNLSAHKVAGVEAAINAVGARVLYLPPYSPDFNPIETLFSKFKYLLRSAAERTVEALWTTCGKLIDEFPESECRNHIRHCGYRYI